MAHRIDAAIVVAALLAAAAGSAQAQSAGALIVRVGATRIAPDVRSGDLTPPSLAGTRADVRADTQPSAGLTWMASDNLAIDVPLAAGFKHDITGAGAIAGVGKIGEVKVLPITLLAQYRFAGANDALRPYVGLGPTYARFYKARSTATLNALTGGLPSSPTTLSVDSRWGFTAQLGLAMEVAPRWYLDAAVLKTKLKTRTSLSTGQTLNIKLDPWTYTVGIGYRF
ncbi:MAG: outer membrane beta-barrel protein [Proteobacteria bacterium]|jgi:outer membrane protein|nr:outer membrane beta-barrel protein [Pseudomonadota bacterium]